MYVHPQEIDYNIETLFELIDASGLEFVGFSNPGFWDLERLLGKAPEIIERTKGLSQREIYRLIELLDPETSHYEFFLARPPLTKANWENDSDLLAAIPEIHPCMDGFPSQVIFNYDYKVVNLSDGELAFMQGCDGSKAVGEILNSVDIGLDGVRSLQRQQLIMLSPTQ
jgi:hypothetical protein